MDFDKIKKNWDGLVLIVICLAAFTAVIIWICNFSYRPQTLKESTSSETPIVSKIKIVNEDDVDLFCFRGSLYFQLKDSTSVLSSHVFHNGEVVSCE